MVAKNGLPELSGNNFDEFVKSGICVVDFFAEWCMPCLMMAPVMDEMASKFRKIKFGKINVDDNPGLASKFRVSSIPCVIFFKNSEEADRQLGAVSAGQFEEKLKKLAA